MPVASNSLQRSLAYLTLGAVRDIERARAAVASSKLQEGFQQFQIPVMGTANYGVLWAKLKLEFDFIFFAATGQRDSPYDRPQFSYGYVVEAADDKAPVVPVFVSCAVQYIDTDDGATRGCWLHVGVLSPTAEARPFEGYLHVTFQGWGAPSDDAEGNE